MTNSSSPRRGVLIAEEIQAAILNNELVIGASKDRVHGCSYDMTVGTVFWEGQIVHPAGRQFTVLPGGLVSIFTAEELKLPCDVCATAFAINKMSSRGFLVLNPGHVDPGFEGPLTVKALNVRRTPIAIQQGDPIFTVVFEKLEVEAGRYKNNASRADREREFNAQTVEHSPSSLSEMIALNNEGPYPTRQEMRELIREHWMSYAFLGLSAVAAVAGALSLWLQLRPIDINPDNSTSADIAFQGLPGAPIAPNNSNSADMQSTPRPGVPSEDRRKARGASADQGSSENTAQPTKEKTQ